MRFLIFMIALFFYSSIAAGKGECKAHAEAVVGILEFDIDNCKIDGDLVHKNGMLSGTFYVDLAKMTTGVELRDKHMRNKYLKTKKYPKAKLVLKPLKIGSKKFSGALTLHGKTHIVTGSVLSSSPKRLEAKFDINITDYGIKKPGYKGIVVGQDISITATVR